jgi:hypothetical protein
MKNIFEKGISSTERKKRKKIFLRGLLQNYMRSPMYRNKQKKKSKIKRMGCGCK